MNVSHSGQAADTESDILQSPDRLKKRSEFLAARRGRRLNGPYFFVETHVRGDDGSPRIGLTVTKKVGNAVVRNRIKRRLREAVRIEAAASMRRGVDYVVVARRDVLTIPFATLAGELSRRFTRFDPARAAPRAKRPADRSAPPDETASKV